MDNSHDLPMTRSRIYGLIASFETDMRKIFEQFVVADLGEVGGLGQLNGKAEVRRSRDSLPESERPSLIHYLDLKETYELLNEHGGSLPSSLAGELVANTSLIDSINIIRRRVAHSRPLAPGDGERSVSLLSQFRTRWWTELKALLEKLEKEPNWEPSNFSETELSSVLHNLPYAEFDETGLIGRQRELEDILRLIKRGREPIVTIVGEGGVGKTALAVQAAYELVDSEDCPFDAVLWTSLKTARLTASGIREIKGNAQSLLGAMGGAQAAMGMNPMEDYELLSEAFSDIECLLILDNLETVGADDFRRLYEALPPSVKFLVTSRVGIGEFERRYTLDPLGKEDALELFDEYAKNRQQQGLLSLSKETRSELVLKLRRSPLAIRWYVLSVEAGKDPFQTIHNQSELLDFCVKSVYDDLTHDARSLLTAMMIMGRDVSLDEAVVLLDISPESGALAMQELVRGSMVRRVSSPEKTDLRLLARLTETASSFLNVVDLGSAEAQEISNRKMEMLRIGEQRQVDAAERSLAPIVIRTRNKLDGASAQILREAYLKFTARENEEAFELVQKARELNPDYWEVYRLQGYMRGTLRQETLAESSFQRAMELADGDPEATAVVSHFYAGHIARAMKNPEEAVKFEHAAHRHFNSPETGSALGNYLVWCRRHAEGIEILEASLREATGRTQLICATSLAESWVRLSEYTESSDSNVVIACDQAWSGYMVAREYLIVGVVDRKLRDVALEAARLSIRFYGSTLRAGLSPTRVGLDLSVLSNDLPMLAATRRYESFAREVSRIEDYLEKSESGVAFLAWMASIEVPTGDEAGERMHGGRILNIHPTFAFIECPALNENLFFHQSDWIDALPFGSLADGQVVSFVPKVEGGRNKAVSVMLED